MNINGLGESLKPRGLPWRGETPVAFELAASSSQRRRSTTELRARELLRGRLNCETIVLLPALPNFVVYISFLQEI